jgi:hypothetical protein
MPDFPRRHAARVVLPLALATAALALTGCNNAGQGAFTGGAAGALGGLAIGSLSGDTGEGAAIGAVSGALVGGVLGDQNARNAPNRAAGHASYRERPHRSRPDPWWRDPHHD